MGVRVAPLPPLAAMVERSRHRALNPEAGVRIPVAVPNAIEVHARWSSGKTSGCYPESGGSSPSLAAHRSVAEDSGARLQTARRG